MRRRLTGRLTALHHGPERRRRQGPPGDGLPSQPPGVARDLPSTTGLPAANDTRRATSLPSSRGSIMSGEPFRIPGRLVPAPARPRRGGRRGTPSRAAVRPRVEVLEERLPLTPLPPGFTEAAVPSGLNSPTAMDFA